MLSSRKMKTGYQDSRMSNATPGTSHCLVGRIRTGYQDNRKSDNSRHITLSEGKIRTAGHLTQLQGHHVVWKENKDWVSGLGVRTVRNLTRLQGHHVSRREKKERVSARTVGNLTQF